MRRRRTPAPGVQALECRRLPATITVNTTSDAAVDVGEMTLREAILVSDETVLVSTLTPAQQSQVSGPVGPVNTIDFDIPGQGVHQILPTSSLPPITNSLTIDGDSQPGSSPNTRAVGDNAVPLIELSGTDAPVTSDGLYFNGTNTSFSKVDGLIINDWGHGTPLSGVDYGGNGVYINNSSHDVIAGNFLGTDPTGLVAVPDLRTGVIFNTSAQDTLGGTSPADRNVAAVGGAAVGQNAVWLHNVNGSTIEGNYLGVGANGRAFAALTPMNDAYGVYSSNSSQN